MNDELINELINELYNKLDLEEKIINKQLLKITELKDDIEYRDKIIDEQSMELDKLSADNILLKNIIDKTREYIKENSYIAQDKEINGIPLMSKRLDKCDDLLEILEGKENE